MDLAANDALAKNPHVALSVNRFWRTFRCRQGSRKRYNLSDNRDLAYPSGQPGEEQIISLPVKTTQATVPMELSLRHAPRGRRRFGGFWLEALAWVH